MGRESLNAAASTGTRRLAISLGVALTIGLSTGGASSAQVLEFGPNGAVAVHDQPAVWRPNAVVELALPAQEPARPASHVGALLSPASEASGVSRDLLEAVAFVESRFSTAAVSPKGALGMMQLMPTTASDLGVDPADPAQNAIGGATYLASMLNRFEGNIELALAAYNAGPAAVVRYGGVPPYSETRAYVAAVLDYLAGKAAQEPQ